MSGSERNSLFVMLLVLFVPVLTPFANDMFLVSLPTMQHYFHAKNIQLMMSVFLFGYAVSQLAYGPLSDRFGRKPVLITGLIVFIVGSMVASTAVTFKLLLLGRLIQSFGVASTIVSVMAIIRDSYPKEEIIKYVAITMGIIGVCPAISPIIGSILQAEFGWRGSMVFMMASGVVALCLVSFFFKESMIEKNHHALHYKKIIGTYCAILSNKQYQGYALAGALGFSIFFSYLASAPTIIMTLFHKSITDFALLFALNATALIITSIVAPSISRNKGSSFTLTISTGLMITGGILMMLFHAALWEVTASMFFISLGVGLIRPTASAGAIKLFPANIAGSASAMYSFISFFVAGTVVSFVHVMMTHSLLLFATILTGLAFLTIVSSVRSQCRGC